MKKHLLRKGPCVRLMNAFHSLSERRQEYVIYGCLALFALFFLTFFSAWTSPYFKYWYGGDSSFYSMVGRGILEGKVPYRDFFDLKGPYLFFIEAIGQFLHRDRLGIFLIQIPFTAASYILVYKIARLFLSRKKTLLVIATFFFLAISTYWGGNTLEEYCLPFNLACVYVTTKFIKSDRSVFPARYAVLFGISFGFMLFSKVTIASPVGAACLYFFFYFLCCRRYQEVGSLILYFLTGLLIAFAPVAVYCTFHQLWKDMIYCVFEFAFKRSVDYGETFNLTWELKVFGCTTAFFFALLEKKLLDRQLRYFLLTLSLVVYLALHLGTPYIYYFTTSLPVVVLAMSVFLYYHNPVVLFTTAGEAAAIIGFLILIVFYKDSSWDTTQNIWKMHNNVYYSDFYTNAKELYSLIPEWERDQIYCLSPEIPWWEINQAFPCYKYQINVNWFWRLDPKIKDEVMSYMQRTPPRWIVAHNRYQDDLPELTEILNERYVSIAYNGAGELFLRVN